MFKYQLPREGCAEFCKIETTQWKIQTVSVLTTSKFYNGETSKQTDTIEYLCIGTPELACSSYPKRGLLGVSLSS